MRMSVCRVYVFVSIVTLGLLAAPLAAEAQYRPRPMGEGGIAEDFHIEAAYGWWMKSYS